MPTTSIYKGLTIPTPAGDVGIWGPELNNTIIATDSIIGQSLTLNSSTTGVAITVTSSQAQSARFNILNTSSQAYTLNLPASNAAVGQYQVGYNSSQGGNLSITAGSSGTGGTNVTMLPNTNRLVYNDGVNILFSDAVLTQSAIGFSFDGGLVAPSSGTKPGIVVPFTFIAQSWQVSAWDTTGSMSVDVYSSGVLASSHSTPTLTSANQATGSASGWSQTTFSSGATVNPFVNSASSATKFSLMLFGIRVT